MKRFFILISLLLFSPVWADVPDEQKAEIKHLFKFIKNSACSMNRNGNVHPTEKAITHIQTKYDYYRDDIKTTEDFIALSATKSTMSGEYYTVTCLNNKTIKTKDWLLAELRRYRTTRSY